LCTTTVSGPPDAWTSGVAPSADLRTNIASIITHARMPLDATSCKQLVAGRFATRHDPAVRRELGRRRAQVSSTSHNARAAPAPCHLEAQKTSSILAEDGGAIFLGDRHSPDAVKHEAEASDLVGIVATCQQVAGSGELDRHL